jgi:hypothetical protein
MRTYKSLLGLLALTFIILAVKLQGWDVFWIPHALALEPSREIDSLLKNMQTFQGYLFTGLTILTFFFFRFLEIALSPDLLTVNSDMLNQIWMLARDIVNLIFVFILLGGTVVTVVKGSTENLKAMAPKFVFGLVLVNFTWFLPRVALDVAQLSANMIFELPNLVGATGCEVNGEECDVVMKVFLFDEIKNNEYGQTIITGAPVGGLDWKCPMEEILCYGTTKYSMATMDPQSKIINGLIVNYGRMTKFAEPPVLAVGAAPSISTAIIALLKMLVALFIYIAICFPLAALVFALFIRIPILWLTIAFMPFAVLSYVLPDFGGISEVKSLTKKIMEEFFSNAFLPAMVAIPFTIGFIMIHAALDAGTVIPTALQSTELTSILSTSFIANLWQLVWLIMALVVLWAGVFMALSKQKIGAGITNSIKGTGEALGKLPGQMILGSPIIPMPKALGGTGEPGREKASLATMWRLPTRLSNDFKTGSGKFSLPGEMDNAANKIADAVKNSTHRAQIDAQVKIVEDSTKTVKERSDAMDIIKQLTRDAVKEDPALKNASEQTIVQALDKELGRSGNLVTKFERLEKDRTAGTGGTGGKTP